jgi:hypothetical protein
MVVDLCQLGLKDTKQVGRVDKDDKRKLIMYNTINVITIMRKHVNLYHYNFFLNLKKSIVFCRKMKDNLHKETKYVSSSICKKIAAKEPFKKYDVQQKQILEDLGLLIIKNHLPLQFVENIWLKRFSMQLCPKIGFSSRKQNFHELLPR